MKQFLDTCKDIADLLEGEKRVRSMLEYDTLTKTGFFSNTMIINQRVYHINLIVTVGELSCFINGKKLRTTNKDMIMEDLEDILSKIQSKEAVV